MDLDRAACIAANRNQRQREQFPLFAEQLDPITAEQVLAAAASHAEAFEQCRRELQIRGDAFRDRLALVVTPEELADLDRRRAILPDGPEYHADFWPRQWQHHHHADGA